MINIITKGELQTVCSQIGMCFADEYQSFVQIDRIDGESFVFALFLKKSHFEIEYLWLAPFTVDFTMF